MRTEIKIPKMGESIVEVTIGAILKSPGSEVKEGDEILEIETEKANQVLSAPASGILELSIKQGDKATIDQVIGSVGDQGSATSSVAAPKAKGEAAPPPPSPPPKVSGKETRKKMSNVRKVIAERLVQVKNETAMLTTFNEVDMEAIIQLRKENQELFQQKQGVKLGFMPFFVKAVVGALQAFPELNARIEKEEIVYSHYYDIGIAVGTEKGLFVPVIRNADQLSIAEIEKAIQAFAAKAKTGAITVDEMQGGTFTITNGGTFGSMLSTPILNPPQSGILGMHNIVKRAVVIDDNIAIRPIMYLALSYDHRVVDGKEAISFLVHIKKRLEDKASFSFGL